MHNASYACADTRLRRALKSPTLSTPQVMGTHMGPDALSPCRSMAHWYPLAKTLSFSASGFAASAPRQFAVALGRVEATCPSRLSHSKSEAFTPLQSAVALGRMRQPPHQLSLSKSEALAPRQSAVARVSSVPEARRTRPCSQVLVKQMPF